MYPRISSEHVEQCKGKNDLDKVILKGVGRCSAEVYLNGGQVTSWTNECGEELLFLSCRAPFNTPTVFNRGGIPICLPEGPFNPPMPIRGGIPICFPEFASIGSFGEHGFARSRIWNVDYDPPKFPSNINTSNKASVDLILRPCEQRFNIWPHRVALGPTGSLMLTSCIRNANINGNSFTFTFAYHSFFSVIDISEVRVEGLETLNYLDYQNNKEEFTEQADSLTFESEVDKVYLNTPTRIAIMDHLRRQTIEIRKEGLPDAVLWIPWDKNTRPMPDLEESDFKRMLCLGAACLEIPITLKPGEMWTGHMELSVLPSTKDD